MSEPALARRIHVSRALGDEWAVPNDVAAILGEDAQMQIGPGQVVTLRPAKLSSAALAADVEPISDPAQLVHATSPLTAEERQALAEFLSE